MMKRRNSSRDLPAQSAATGRSLISVAVKLAHFACLLHAHDQAFLLLQAGRTTPTVRGHAAADGSLLFSGRPPRSETLSRAPKSGRPRVRQHATRVRHRQGSIDRVSEWRWSPCYRACGAPAGEGRFRGSVGVSEKRVLRRFTAACRTPALGPLVGGARMGRTALWGAPKSCLLCRPCQH